MKTVKLGTIGSGNIVHTILDCVLRTPDIQLEAVYSRTQEKGESLAKQYGAGKVYTDLAAFLADSEVNTVYIATPNLLHYEQTKAALLAGKHVICEKPFVTRTEQAEELALLARERGCLLFEAAPTTFLPNFRILQRELPKLGRIKLVMSNYSQYSSRYDKVLAGERPNIFQAELAGGALMDINYYNVFLNAALFGAPEQTTYYPNLYPGLADTSGSVVLRYPGFVSQNAGAKDTWGVNFFQIEGEQGYIYVEGGANGLASVRVVTKTSDETFDEQPEGNRWLYEIREITRILQAEDLEASQSRMKITVASTRILEEARRSAGINFPGDK